MKKTLLTALATLGISIITIAQVPSYVPTNGLVGWWPFTGNAIDSSGNGNNGTVLNGTILAADRFNNANSSYEVDGINCPNAKGVSLPALINNANSYSISIWFQTTDSTKTDQTIFNSFPHQYIGVNFNYPYTGFENKTCSFFGNGTWQVQGSTVNWNTYNLNSWHNIVVIKNTLSISYYQDGLLKYNLPMQSGFNSGSFTSIVVGANSINGGSQCYETFKGKIDDVAIWNRELTPQEITGVYNSVSCTNSTSINPLTNSLSLGSTATFNASTSDQNPTYVWQSDFGQGFQSLNNFGSYSGVNTATLNIANVQLSEHNQSVRVISTSGSCVDTSNVAVINILDTCIVTVYDTLLTTVTDTLVINAVLTGIIPPNNQNTLKVYPNPSSTHITIDYGTFSSMSGYTLKIVNSIGQVVFTTAINQQTSVIDLSTWTGNGIYFVQVIDSLNNTIENRKIVIQ